MVQEWREVDAVEAAHEIRSQADGAIGAAAAIEVAQFKGELPTIQMFERATTVWGLPSGHMVAKGLFEQDDTRADGWFVWTHDPSVARLFGTHWLPLPFNGDATIEQVERHMWAHRLAIR